MLHPEDEERLEQIISRFGNLIQLLQKHQSHSDVRLTNLYRIVFIAMTLVISSISFLVILLAFQIPQMNHAMERMNHDFSSIATDMDRLQRSIDQMELSLHTMPGIIVSVDQMRGQVSGMATDIHWMTDHMLSMDQTLEHMSLSLVEMRSSFQLMDTGVRQMSRDMEHLSAPVRLFNQFNPFQ